MKKVKIKHIGIVVQNLGESTEFFKKAFGLSPSKREILEDRGLEIASIAIGDTEIELITPIRKGTAIDKFLEKRGGGLHHIAIIVENLDENLKRMERMGINVVDGPKRGKEGYRVAFLDPKRTFKTLFELIEEE